MGVRRKITAVGLSVALLLFAGCGWLFPRRQAPAPETAEILTQVISAQAGGSIVVTQEMCPSIRGLELTIPAGALEADQRIVVGAVVSGLPPLPDGYVSLGYSISLEPHGLSFQTPVTLSISLGPDDWPAWSEVGAPEVVRLLKCDHRTAVWTEIPAGFDGAVLTAQLQAFSWVDVVVSWFRHDPTGDKNVRKQASAWRPRGDAEEWLQKRPFMDQGAFPGAIKPLPSTFKDAIRALLLAEAQWEAISDGNFYKAASYVEVALKTWLKSLPVDLLKKALGLPTLGMALTISLFILETSLNILIEDIGAAAVNNQLQCYLSWRGWFYKRDTKSWVHKPDFARTHAEVMADPQIPRADSGWFLYYQKPDGNPGGLGYSPTVPLNKRPGELFGLAKLLCDLLTKVHTTVTPPGALSTMNGLAADRHLLERAFRGWNRPPTVRVPPQAFPAAVGQNVTLSGEASDFENDSLVSQWVQVSGPQVTQSFSWDSQAVYFTPADLGEYVFRLDVWDHLLLEGRPSSASVTITVTEDSADRTPPTIPTNLAAVPISSTRIDISWNASTDDVGVAGYRIYRDASLLTSLTATSYSDTGLSPATRYCYRVSAYDRGENESVRSNAVCATTLAVQPPHTSVSLAMYVHDGSLDGQVIVGARVQGSDAAGIQFDKTTNDGGYVTITGEPGTWAFTVSKSGYMPKSWSQPVSDSGTARVSLQKEESTPPGGCTATVGPGESIQAAIDAAPAGAVVCLGAGEFYLYGSMAVPPLAITKPLTLRGQGPEATKIISQSSWWNVITVDTPYGDVRIADLTIQGYQCNPDWGNSAVAAKANRLVIENCTIVRDCTHSSCGGWLGPIYGIDASEVAVETIIRGCTVSGFTVGITAGGAQTVTIEDCVITGTEGFPWLCGRHGIWVGDNIFGAPDVTIRRCTISDLAMGILLCGEARVAIEDNQVLRNLTYGIALGGRECGAYGCYDDYRVFTGLVTGRRNRIPGPGEVDGNGNGGGGFSPGAAVCPSDLSFLVTSTGGTLDRRR